LGVSTKTFYKYLKRFAVEGVDGFYPRSRKPSRSPARVDSAVEDAIVRARKELDDDGWDAGAEQIAFWLEDHPDQWPAGAVIPSRATINRVLDRRGLMARVPTRRPKAARRRFEAAQPNEMWQLDGFEYRLRDGTVVVILQLLDDCSRYDLALRAAVSENGADTWETVLDAIKRYGLPRRFLSDNSTAFSGKRRGWIARLEENLRTLGVVTITSRIAHPQTCGKIERVHQTCLKWLRKRPPARSLTQLQTLLGRYRDHYNHHRRKTHLGGLSPAQRYALGPRDGPGDQPVPWPVITTTGQVSTSGCVGADGHLLGIGRKHAGTTVTMIKQHHEIAVFDRNELIAQFTITNQRRYLPPSPKLRPDQTDTVLPMS
jgi:transposase InsO family protein